MKSQKLLIIALLALVPGWAKAEPQPLTLVQIGQMKAYLACEEQCYHGPTYALEECLAACPSKQANWEKNQDLQIDMIDARLAVLEYWDEGSLEYICYQDEAVQYKALCEDCLANHTEEQCIDADGDGIPQWKEEELGTDDSTPAVFCHQDAECDFHTECHYHYLLGQSICTARDCGAACTAFHLERVAENNQELIVHVHYDYSPTPARVLSLFLEYPDTDLTLLDVRPLPLLKQSNKQVIKNHLSNGVLKLVVIGTMSKEPIPTGAIVELVFARISPNQTMVRFTKNDFEQEHSLAPSQGERQQDLHDDALWGEDIQIAAADPNGNRLLLSYSFENHRNYLEYQDTKENAELCTLDSICNNLNPDQETVKTRKLAMLSALQRGVVAVNEQITGVLGHGVYLDGFANHLEMPITLNDPPLGTPYRLVDQGFSLSFWFFADGNAGSLSDEPQVLFSHNNSVEKTRFGLLLQQEDAEKADLLWFEGGLNDADITKRVVGKDILLRTWTHVGMAVDAEANRIEFYLNGESTDATTALAYTPAIQCPQFETSPGTGIILHDEGDLSLGAQSPEVLFYASAKNNLYGIEQMDLLGLSSREILRDGNADVKDPDYSPLVDKLVYSSNKSGNYEIWIANGDGSNPRQITLGFGDTGRKIFSRRPKWAPDASAIVFESNIYSIPEFDNWWSRGYHLYYIQYDPKENEVAIPINGNKASQLDYQMLLQNQIVSDYRLTTADQNHYQTVWLKGKSTEDQTRGELLMNTADLKMEEKRIYRLTIPQNIIDSQPGPMAPFAADPVAEVNMITANRVVDHQGEHASMLLKKEWNSYESTTQYSLRVETISEDEMQVVVTHTPNGYDPHCFDIDHSNPNVGDSDEDRNQDGKWDERDCYPADVRNLYISYDAQSLAPNLPVSGPGAALATEEEGGVNKKLELKELEGLGKFVRVEVLSPYNNNPLPASAEIAKVVFSINNSGSTPALVERVVHQELFIKDLTSNQDPEPFLVLENHLEHVLAGAFSPDGTRLLLSGIQNSRPVLVVTKDTASTDGMEKISNMPMRVEGLNWIKQERYYPCNWFGAHRDRYTKRYLSAFRGGLDELKLYSYAREANAFLSDAQRGLERLVKENRDGLVDSRLPQCATSDFECPPYHLCINEKCQMIGCEPDDPYSCIRGQCTLAPVSTGAEEENLDWVCSVECNYDRECFEEECLNGPCRFCDAQAQSCMECRPTVKDFGSFKLEYIKGCPDRNSFACEEGSCVTQCYSFENGESIYLCDPALEYCKQGRCVLFDWDWTDFAPASFSGMGEMAFSLPELHVTTSISQLYPVEIKAYGVKDYLHPPEILIQGKVTTPGAQVYNGAWFDIGRILIYNTNKVEAQNDEKSYIIYTPFPVTDLRLQLITPPYENLNASATGLMGRDKDFCVARMRAIADATGTVQDLDFCTRRASGSRFSLGYRVGLPAYEVAKDCFEAGYANCNHIDDGNRKYLYGGQPAAIILDVKANGTSVFNGIQSNKICSYEGSKEPVDPNDEELKKSDNKKVIYGDSAREMSNQKDTFYPDAPSTSLIEFVAHTGKTWALLNCNFADKDNPDQVAQLTMSFNLSYPSFGQEGSITETANNCIVAIDDQRNEPCYEQIGSDGSLDVMNLELQSLHTLDYSTFRSFGYDFVPCQYVTCSGHGTCTYENNEEHCDCDEGYVESEGLRCVAIEN